MINLPQDLPSKIKIGNRLVGKGEPAFLIADIGANHNGDYFLARRSIERAAEAGADAVKLQKRFISEVATKELLDREQTKDQVFGKTYKEYRLHLELNEEEYRKLKELSEKLGMIFYSTPFDIKSVDFLERVGVDVYKIASQDQTHLPLVEYIAKKSKPIIMSVGAANQEETDEAIKTILQYNDQLMIQYCVSVYPTPDELLRLSNIVSMVEQFKPLPVGYSGHEKDVLPSLVAVALGAKSIERHFTIDKDLPGPDHATVSLNPAEFKEMATSIRRIERSFGEPVKELWEEEIQFRHKHGVSLVSAKVIPAGMTITEEMLTVKCPGYGLKPNMKDKVIGRKAKVDIPEDIVIIDEFIEW